MELDDLDSPPPLFMTGTKNNMDNYTDNSMGNNQHNHHDELSHPNPENILQSNPNDIMNFHSNLNDIQGMMNTQRMSQPNYSSQNINQNISQGNSNTQSINPQNLKLPSFNTVNPYNINLQQQNKNNNNNTFTNNQQQIGLSQFTSNLQTTSNSSMNSFNPNTSPFTSSFTNINNPSGSLTSPIKTQNLNTPINIPSLNTTNLGHSQQQRFQQQFNPQLLNQSPNRFQIPNINPQQQQTSPQNISFNTIMSQNRMNQTSNSPISMSNNSNTFNPNSILSNNIKLNMFNQNSMGGMNMNRSNSNTNNLPSLFHNPNNNLPNYSIGRGIGNYSIKNEPEEYRVTTRSQMKKNQVKTENPPNNQQNQMFQRGGQMNQMNFMNVGNTVQVKQEPKVVEPNTANVDELPNLTEEKCYKILEKLVKNPNSWPFRTPVNPTEWGINDYFDVIEEPMDLGTVSDKLSQTDMLRRTGPYVNMNVLVKDVRLIWKNCKTYNKQNSEIWLLADSMEREFETLLSVATGMKPPPPPRRTGGGGRGRGRPKKTDEPVVISGPELDEMIGFDDSDSDSEKEKVVEMETGFTSSGKRRIDEIYTHREIKEPVEGGPKHEYYIKWKMFSHLHCQWVPEDEISYAKIQLRNYWKKVEEKKSLGIEEVEEEEDFFDERYVQVDRFLSQKKQLIKNEDGTTSEKTVYLVKWVGLPYTDSTWELSDDIKDDEKLEEFNKTNLPRPPVNEVRPPPSAWKRLAECPAFKDGNKLRSYQLEGLNWMVFNWYQRRGSILADEMGLGKTVQTVGFIEYLRKYENIGGPYLVVCPLSTLMHWEREFKGWTEMNVITYCGSGKNRAVIREHEWYSPNKELKFDILLSTYEMIIANDWEEIKKINWKVVIVDEAQRMKSIKSIFRTNMMNLKSDHRLLLTGTPIQNNTTELWALLNFISPWSFPILEHFVSLFGELKTSEQVKQLHTLLRPYLLRRMKEDVEKSIPPKEETIVEVEMTILQKQYYRAILEKNKLFLTKGCDKNNVPNLLNISMQLRKICNHPFLLKGVEEKQTSHFSDQNDYMNDFLNSSGKFVLLDKLLPKLKEGGHKVLIFSQMVKVLDLIAVYLEYKKYGFERIDGRIRGNDRQASIDRFCSDKYDKFVFLLCTRAGGVGINLASADTVIIFDSDWNPQNDLQAQARAHRIGQKNLVQIYRLITRNTYERQMFERSSKKLGLDQAVLSDFGSSTINTKLNAEDIDKLLKYGAYDLFRDEEEQNNLSKKFQDSSIDQILQKSAKKINYNQNDKKNENQGESTFAKATFQISSSENAIDINAENFWDLVMGESKTAAVLLTELEEEMCFKNKKTLQSFWKHLRTIVTDSINSWNSGRFEDIPADLHILVELVSKIKDDLRFSSDQRKKAFGWHDSLNNTGRKGRRRRGGNNELDMKPSKKGKNVLNTSDTFEGDFLDDWKKNDKTNFINALVSFGSKCLEDIKRITKIDKTLEEMKSFTLGFLFICEKNSSEDKDKQIFRKQRMFLENKQKTTESDVEDSLKEPQIYQTILSNLKIYSKKLRLVERLNELIEKYPGKKWLEFKLPSIEEKLTDWWTETEDKDLLLGSLIHGVGNFELISSEPKLCFHQGLRSLVRQKNQLFPSGVISVVVQINDQEHNCDNKLVEQNFKNNSYWKSEIPQLRSLNTRVKHILDAIDLADGKKKPPKKVKAEVWAKKDQTTFISYLLVNGRGDWTNMIKNTGLSKTETQMEDFCNDLILICEKITKTVSSKVKDEDYSPKVKIDEKSISISHAQKILDRVNLFETIRTKMLVKEDIESFLRKEASIAGMPTWWKAGQDDLTLLKIVGEHGINPSSFETIFESSDVSFYTNKKNSGIKEEKVGEIKPFEDEQPKTEESVSKTEENAPKVKEEDQPKIEENKTTTTTTTEENISEEEKENRKKFLRLFLQEKTPLIVRLSYLTSVFTSPSTAKEDFPDSFLWSSCGNVDPSVGAGNGSEAVNLGGNQTVSISIKGGIVINLGRIVYENENFHSQKYIWPVGYQCIRKLQKLNEPPTVLADYLCEIVNENDAPKFVVRLLDDEKVRWEHKTASGVWNLALKDIKKQFTPISGPEMYCYSDPKIQELIQELPNAEKCTKYVWKNSPNSTKRSDKETNLNEDDDMEEDLEGGDFENKADEMEDDKEDKEDPKDIDYKDEDFN